MYVTTKELTNGWTEYTLTNDSGMAVSVINYGGIITKMLVPDRNGTPENVVLGYKNITDYGQNDNFLGAQIGRVAGRIKNGRFDLNNHTYTLEKNDGDNHLHGGSNGFHASNWDVRIIENEDSVCLELTHRQGHLHDGYPGDLTTTITYTLTNNNGFKIDYRAQSTEDTPIALTNHSYFNLSGNMKETVGNHHLQLNGKHIAELDEALIPSGKMLDTKNTPFDFSMGHKLADGFNNNHPQLKLAGSGYDHYFTFAENEKEAILFEEISGRKLKVTTDQPGLVLYTANGLDDSLGLTDGKSQKYMGVCLEAQAHPAGLLHENFPSIILKKADTYKKHIYYQFSAE